jgi:hypothetical protein
MWIMRMSRISSDGGESCETEMVGYRQSLTSTRSIAPVKLSLLVWYPTCLTFPTRISAALVDHLRCAGHVSYFQISSAIEVERCSGL